MSEAVDKVQPEGDSFLLWVVGSATDATGGNSAGCHTDRFIVWKVRPRRRKMLYAKLSRARFGGGRPVAAASLLSRRIETKFHLKPEVSSLRLRSAHTQGADPRMRLGGITPTRQESSLNRTQTTKTMRLFRPMLSIINPEQVEVLR